jgi:hypothetical protein
MLLEIESIHINDVPASYQYFDPLAHVFASSYDESQFGVERIAQLRHRMSDRIIEGDRGELCISIPEQVKIIRVKQERSDTQLKQQQTLGVEALPVNEGE